MGKLAGILSKEFKDGVYDEKLKELYVSPERIVEERERYSNAIQRFIEKYGDTEVSIFSAPGRSEIGGNHTDHQQGRVLTASVNIDAIAVVRPLDEPVVGLYSEGYGQILVDISTLEPKDSEKESSPALIRGVAAGFAKRGYKVTGFEGYMTSEVLSGSGLSSSAAVEVLFGEIFSGLCHGDVDSVTIAQIGKEAENIFFGKPSGLLDQMGCSVGGLVGVDFKDPEKPVVEPLDIDFGNFGHSLCVVDTKGSHADLTDEYAAIPAELGMVSGFFGKKVLREVPEEDFYANIPEIRKVAGDRAVLRAIHIYDDNKRVDEQKDALLKGDFARFKELIRDSGNSSYRYLQNVYSCKKPEEQSVSLALVLTKKILGKDCACRVQGGGFAGTIEVFVPHEEVSRYRQEIEKIFGEGSCHVLEIRPVGGTQVI